MRTRTERMHVTSGGGEARARLKVRVKPRSSVTEVVGLEDGALVVRVSAPPVEGRANHAVRDLVASILDVARSRVTVEAGQRSRDKVLVIDGLSQAELDASLAKVKPS